MHVHAKECVRRSQDNFPPSVWEALLAQLSARQALSLYESPRQPEVVFPRCWLVS